MAHSRLTWEKKGIKGFDRASLSFVSIPTGHGWDWLKQRGLMGLRADAFGHASYDRHHPHNDCGNYETGITYIGEFENGRPHGRGKLLHKDGKQVMEGNWVDGKEEGVFTITIADQPKKTVEIKSNNIVRILS